MYLVYMYSHIIRGHYGKKIRKMNDITLNALMIHLGYGQLCISRSAEKGSLDVTQLSAIRLIVVFRDWVYFMVNTAVLHLTPIHGLAVLSAGGHCKSLTTNHTVQYSTVQYSTVMTM